MNTLFDVVLGRPLPLGVIRGLLFGTFALHMLLALITLGTAILGMVYVARSGWGGKAGERPWAKGILHTLLGYKSLAVVLGVAPLLLIQVGFPVPFFTAVNLFAPYWMLVIPFLIAAFLTLDFVAANTKARPHLRLALGTIGLALLLAVPGIFVAILTATEYSGAWLEIIRRGYRLPGPLAYHWLFRYLHVIGASVVFGAAVHYFATPEGEHERRRSLLRWMLGGLLVQIVLGLLLYLSVPARPGTVANFSLALSVIGVVVLFWRLSRPLPPSLISAVSLLLVILIPMLLARQALQDRAILPLHEKLEGNAARYRTALRPFAAQGLWQYLQTLETVYDSGQTIYVQSCAFCHGQQADGKGVEAANLTVPPEVLGAVRAHRAYFRDRLREGVPGSGMPYFTVYTRGQVDDLVSYLDRTYHVLAPPESATRSLPASTVEQASATFVTTCAPCHGVSGQGDGPAARGLQPPPPDLRRYTLTPQRMLEVITAGYPGTAMPAFASLGSDLRRGLVEYAGSLYEGQPRR